MREFSYTFFQSVSHNSVFVTKQIYFSPIFLKLWAHNSDSTADVVRGLQNY